MEKIALLTDSACDLTLDELKEFDIKLLPLKIIYSNKEYNDILDISADTVYNNLEKEVPSTSLPSIETIENTLNKLESEGYTHVIGIMISSGLSGTFNALRLALEDHPNLKSFIFDTKILARPEGIIVSSVGRLIKEGKSFDEIIEILPGLRKDIMGVFTLNTLEYLKKGGRIGKVSGTIGELLSLKPLIGVDDDGVYYTICKARGRKQALSKLTDLLKDNLNKSKCNVWVLQGGCLEEAKNFLDSIKDLPNIASLDISSIGPALGVHTGPGLLGLAIQKVK